MTVTDPDNKLGQLRPGQVWSIKGGPNPAARAVIGRVEPFQGRMVAHLSVRNLEPPSDIEGFGEEAELYISHIPIALEAAAESLSILISPAGDVSGEFEEAYADWKAAADQGQAGIFIQSIPMAIDNIFTVMRTGIAEKE